mgnify:CR=1 FL=1
MGWLRLNLPSVSIPKRVSAKVERVFDSFGRLDFKFQSLKGFQPKWNLEQIGVGEKISPFQSLKGFQPKWNVYSIRLAVWILSFNP